MDAVETLQGIVTVIALFGGIPMGVSAVVLGYMHRTERDDRNVFYAGDGSLGNTGAAVCGAATGVALWLLWFSWGDPAGYATWAVVGAVLTALAAVTGIGAVTRWRKTGPFVVSLGGLFGFSSAYAVDAGFYDSTGLWGVGYIMIVVIAGFILAVIATCIVLVKTRRHRS
ncbi:hypothetical protein AALF15_12380 [Corynebacteriaceae bacterium 7-707]